MAISVQFGADPFAGVAQALSARGLRKVLILTGPSRRNVDEATSALEAANISVTVFDGAKVHVPVDVVAQAEEAVRAVQPDALLSIGGGAAVGLGKALRLTHGAAFFVVPTTYAGSEMTSIFGITDGNSKTTGRDDRVRPDAVFYAPDLTRSLPLALKVTSVLNALAHPISVLDSGAEQDVRRAAFEAIHLLAGAAFQLAESPDQQRAHEDGLRGASRAGHVLDSGRPGMHHRIAHWLGGRFAVEHSGLHAVLLPHTLRRMADEQPELFEEIVKAAGVPDLPGHVFDLLARVGAQISLSGLGIDSAALAEALPQGDVPADLVWAAFLGRRPSRFTRREDWSLRQPVTVAGAPLSEATTVVVAIHGRNATAEGIVDRVWQVAQHQPGLAIVAPQAPDRAWYTPSYRESAETMGAPLTTAFTELDAVFETVKAAAPSARKVLFGFSQGACLALEYAARRTPSVAAIVAIAGARLGPTAAYEPLGDGRFRGTSMLLGVAEGDSWVDMPDVSATAAWFETAGATVENLAEPGDAHRLSGRQGLRAGELITGRSRAVQRGFGGAHESEALPEALPTRMNSPRLIRHGLYAEQINGTGFVAERQHNLRAWTYRIRPGAQHTPFVPLPHDTFRADYGQHGHDPNLLGWAPRPFPDQPTDFVDGMATFGGAGRPELRRGFALHLYVANRSMDERAFSNSDGDLLIVPQQGALTLLTELGVLDVSPGHIALVPRGYKFSVLLNDGPARGYVAEAYGRHFELPERGPVGANGLTEARHFVSPTAWYEDRLAPGYRLVNKFCGALYEAQQDYSPYDVVAWHGNYTPYVYDLLDFGPVSNVRFDHPDPSIYTVLSAPMDEQGSNTLDFVFFPPRWDVTEGTFRPPFFHKNATTEFNGIIRDSAGDRAPFYAGGYFMTPSMTAHGVMADAVQRAMFAESDPAPHRSSEASMWFQFESALPIAMTPWAQTSSNRMDDWHARWGTYRTHFRPY